MNKQILMAISILSLLLLSPHSLHAQWDDDLWVGKQADNWIFYYDVGLDFSTSPPTVITNCNTTENNFGFAEGVGTISDSDGNLLFSASKDTVWNKNYQPMQNGYNILNDVSSAQTHLTIPKPGPGNEYYIFQIDDNAAGWADDFDYNDDLDILPQGLAYTEVDMDMDNGLGAVTSKNNLLVTKVSEKLTAVHHANGEDIWVITHEGTNGDFLNGVPPYSSNKFLAFLVTENGIDPNPVVSSVGASTDLSLGQLKVSPDGSMIAFIASGYTQTLQVFDFDNATGQISNPIDLTGALINTAIFSGGWGLEFSPNSRYLYATEIGSGSNYSRLHQFDLEAGNQAAILASDIILAKIIPASFATLQLASNGKIYMANPTLVYRMADPNAAGHLSVINYPNNAGAAADFVHLAVDLQGKDSSHSFPSFIQSYFESGILNEGDDCEGNEMAFSTLRIPGIESVDWDFGDPDSGAENTATTVDGNSSHVFSGPGTYTVTATITSNGVQQTATTEVTILEGATATQPENLVACDDDTGKARFDLTQQDNPILDGQDPSTHTVSYHTTQNDAENNTNPITNPTSYVSSGQSIYARVTTAAGCHAVTQFDLEVAPTPQLPDNLELAGCLPLDLTKIATEVGASLSLGFYPTAADAENSANAIADSTTYFPTNGKKVYLRAENAAGCADIAALALIGEDCAIPQGISPNGDQWNQSFDLSYMNIQNLEIFNRYGRSVFNKESYTNEWFGQTDNGDELPTGTYFYVIKLEEGETFQNKNVLTGWVYVQREVD